ncbi:MAG: LacI family DNA-binding transcriptional regulator [Deltaproteobacteria bacterium]|nr:LacI family DNA-binding transcriptional regulator [Deltaproteobacteria bacterium]
MSRTSMSKIAKLAGVSKATVSRAINTPDLVKDSTLEMIRQIMEKQNYVYDAVASDLSRQKTSVIGVIIPTIRSSIFADSTYGVEEAASQNGYTIIIGNTNYDIQSSINILRLMEMRRVAGIVLTGLSDEERPIVTKICEMGTPCVVTWETLNSTSFSYVGFDNFKAARAMTNYLISLQHTKIGLIVGPFSKVKRVAQRLAGYKAALEEHGLSYDPNLVIETEYSLMEGKEGARALLSLPDPPTAIFAASDVLAMGAMATIREIGMSVPEDISVAGFDDIDFASCCAPPLTTARIPAYEMGKMAMKVLLELMKKDSHQVNQYCLDTNLIIRESCQVYSGNTTR